MAITLGIHGFHNCEGCSKKVRDALREIGVEMVKLDRESGNVTVSSVENREAVRYALERKLKKSVVILSRTVVPANQNARPVVSLHATANRTLDLHQGLGQVALSLVRQGRGVEIRTKDTIGTNFISRETKVVVKPDTRGNSSDRDPQRHHHSRDHQGQPKNMETQVVVKQQTHGHNSHQERNHHHHHHHHHHHGQTSNRETHDNNSHPQRHHHNSHHGQPQNRRHH